MLVLSRKLGQAILLGSDVKIVLCDIDRGKVRIGVDAPRDLPIWRAELLGADGVPDGMSCPRGIPDSAEVKRLRAGLLQLASRTLDSGVKSAVAELLGTTLAGLDVLLVIAAREA